MLLKTAFLLSIFLALTVAQKGRGHRAFARTGNGWQIQTTVLVAEGPPGSDWGKWGEIHMCPENYYAISGRVSDQPVQYNKDDTALNGYQMRCRQVSAFWQHNGLITKPYLGDTYHTQYGLKRNGGVWGDAVTCPEGSLIFAHKVRMEPNLGGEGDDTAINGMSLGCRWSVLNSGSGKNMNGQSGYQDQYGNPQHGMTTNSDDHYVIADVHKWGKMLNWAICPHRSYMCGFQLKGEWKDYEEYEDDYVGMTGMRMICCRMPWDFRDEIY